MTIAAILLIVSYLSIYINPAKAWFMTVFGLLFVPLLVCNFILLIWAVIRKSRAVVIPLLALAPTAFMTDKFFRFNGNDKEDGKGIRIISYNVGRFSLEQTDMQMTPETCADSVMQFLMEQNADIICLQEFYMKDPDNIRSYLSDKMKGYDIRYYINVNAHGAYGNVTLSRFHALNKGKITFEHSSNLALYTDYSINGDIFRVYNCHFESYNISLPGLATSLRKDYKEAFWQTEEKMKRSIVRRPKQVDMVLNDIEMSPEKVIVTGDFNDTPMSYTYWRLSFNRKDSFKEAGRGSGATYSKLWPFLRIDYILFPEDYLALNHKVIHKGFSDHYPIEAVIAKENGGK